MPGCLWFLGAELHFRDTSRAAQGCFSSPAVCTGSRFPGWQALSLPVFQQTSSSSRYFSPYNQITRVPRSCHSPAVLWPLCPTAPEVAEPCGFWHCSTTTTGGAASVGVPPTPLMVPVAAGDPACPGLLCREHRHQEGQAGVETETLPLLVPWLGGGCEQ